MSDTTQVTQRGEGQPQSGERYQEIMSKILSWLLIINGGLVKIATGRLWVRNLCIFWFLLNNLLNLVAFSYLFAVLAREREAILIEGPVGAVFYSLTRIVNLMSYISMCRVAWSYQKFVHMVEPIFRGKHLSQFSKHMTVTLVVVTVLMFCPMLGCYVWRLVEEIHQNSRFVLRLLEIFSLIDKCLTLILIISICLTLTTLFKQFGLEMKAELESVKITQLSSSLCVFRRRYEALLRTAEVAEDILNFPIGLTFFGSVVISCFTMYFLASCYDKFDADYIVSSVFHLGELLIICTASGNLIKASTGAADSIFHVHVHGATPESLAQIDILLKRVAQGARLTAAKLLTVNYSTLLQVMGTLLTYGILIYQTSASTCGLHHPATIENNITHRL